MHKGYLNIVLHAHLPYIRHPEHPHFLEENWLYEAITESYIPLLEVFENLINDKIDFSLTFSLSPTLVEMLNDSLLRERYTAYLKNLIELSEKEIQRTKGDSAFEPLAEMYHKRFKKIIHLYENIFKKDLVSAFRKLADTGNVELITCAATHGYLPVLSIYPQVVKAQIKVAIENHKKNFGRLPRGMWLPECGYYPGLDKTLKEEGIEFFFVESHGILAGKPEPIAGIYKPVMCPHGVVAFGRDMDSSRDVWSSVSGYPGDSFYRDFYKDIGFDLPIVYMKPYIHPDGIRTSTGIKYFRVTDKKELKDPYVRHRAIDKAKEHAEDFFSKRKQTAEQIFQTSGFKPLITSLYDAELFGHWWFEGPEWLDFLLRKIAADTDKTLKTITPSKYVDLEKGNLQNVDPAMSSWGHRGYHEVWLNDSNSWIYKHIHHISEKMIELANIFPSAKGLQKRALNQAAREVLLSQHSDWAFMIRKSDMAAYASKRITEHVERFNFLYHSIKSKNINEKLLAEIEEKDKVFSEIDYRVYADKK